MDTEQAFEVAEQAFEVAEQAFEIVNRPGLHARAATRFVQTASRFLAEIEVERAGRRGNGKSVIGLLLIVASDGAVITIRCRGADSQQALRALATVIGGGLGRPVGGRDGSGVRG